MKQVVQEIPKPLVRKVLIIDDDADQRLVLSTLLEIEGYMVDTASAVSDHWKTLSLNDYHLLISDVMMPNGGGLSVLQTMKQQNCTTPVLMMSAGRDDLKECLLQNGASAFTLKRNGNDELLRLVKALTTP